MYAYAVVYKDKDGYVEYVKNPDTDSYMLYDNNQTAQKAVSFIKEYYKNLLRPKAITKRRFFKKEIIYERIPDVLRNQYKNILNTITVKKVSIL